MVTPMRISPLDRKLLRDLLGMRGQAIAIALVIASGVSMFVTYLSNFDSLQRTERAYYERQRFADVFASLKRAPDQLAGRLAAIPGVAQIETRVVAEVVLDLPDLDEPATGRLVSIPATRRPVLNDLHLRAGEWIGPSRPDEVIANEAFCQANGFHVGDRLTAFINGRARRLTISGIALSPEYVYSIRPGELVPDSRRFGVLWMERRALASAFDMEGGFNDVALTVGPGVSVDDVIARVDRLIAPYGGRGAIPRALQLSNWTVDSELRQLRQVGMVLPAIFFLVAAVVLNVAMTRALALQRSQIAALKALGYSNRELAWHYIKWALAIATAGVVLGVAVGGWLGAQMIALYNEYFRFPVLLYRLSLDVVIGAGAVSLATAALGAYATVRRAVGVPPAEAMRPEPPTRYRRSVVESSALRARLGIATRMVLRNVERQPFRAAASIVGIALACAIVMVGFVFVDALEQMTVTQFTVVDRGSLTLNFFEPRSADTLYALQKLPGVMSVEPVRVVPARLRSGFRHRTLAITSVPAQPELRRIVDRDARALPPPPEGLVLSAILADALGVAPGDQVNVEVLEGAEPVWTVRVSGIVDDVLGVSAYMTADALHRLMREDGTITGANLLIDAAEQHALSQRLKQTPEVAGVAFKAAVVENFRRTLAQNMNLMITTTVVFSIIIAFGVVYNAARVSLSERSRELASLRVLGFSRAEISLILLEELALLTLIALPIGALLGYGLAAAMVTTVESEVYRFPLIVTWGSVARSALVVVGASLMSGLAVRRRLDKLDLVGVLKIRE